MTSWTLRLVFGFHWFSVLVHFSETFSSDAVRQTKLTTCQFLKLPSSRGLSAIPELLVHFSLPPLLTPLLLSVNPLLFHSGHKTYLFNKSFLPWTAGIYFQAGLRECFSHLLCSSVSINLLFGRLSWLCQSAFCVVSYRIFSRR